MSNIVKRASASDPCPCCATGTKGCSETNDGLVLCRAETPARPGDWFDLSPSPDANTFYHRRRIAEKHKSRTGPKLLLNGKPVTNGKASRPPRDWNAKAEEFARNLSDELRRKLSAELFYSPDALDVLPLVGFNPADYHGPCMTFPEFDAAGRVVGILRRYQKGKGPYGSDKVAMPDGKRGLHLPNGWRDRPGAVYVVEGPTDAAALTICGLSAIGRPSNSNGAELIAELLHNLEADREIIVVGENDQKPDGLWPGRDGAVAVGEQVYRKLSRAVSVAFPPEHYKDVRDWVKKLVAGEGESVDPEECGVKIAYYFDENSDLALSPTSSPTPQFQFIDSPTFAGGDYRPQWLVKRMLVRGQPGVVAGPAKALKTNISLDLAVSLASGADFLGQFPVYKPVRVAVVSGESGEHTLQETAHRICKARGLSLASLPNLHWCFTLPTFSEPTIMADFAAELLKLQAEVVIIDPVYLALGAIDARNLFEAGAAFRAVGDALLKAGSTPILNHHANRQLETGEVMDLSHLAYSGLEQFARQFLLLNRREHYRGDGKHDLWMSAGGSCGQGGLWSLHIEEGELQDDFSGRTWDVTVQSLADAKATIAERKAAEKQKTADQKREADRNAVLHAIDVEVEAGRTGATQTVIRVRSGIAPPKLGTVLAELVEFGHIELCEVEKITGNGMKGKYPGYRRAVFKPPAPDQPPPDLLTEMADQSEPKTRKKKTQKNKAVSK